MKKIIFLLLITNYSSLISQTQFQRTIGGTAADIAQSIIQTTDGGYVVAGSTTANENMYIVKLDASGTLQWSKIIDGGSQETAFSIIQTTDGGYVMAGRSGTWNSDMYIVKLDASGSLQWSRTVGGTEYEVAWSIIQTTDGGYTIAGYNTSFGAMNSFDMYIVKLNASGTLQWSRTIGGTGVDIAYSIIQTTDGGYTIAGYTTSFGEGNTDMYIVKLNASGTYQWSKTVGGTNFDWALSIVQTTDGGYTIAGYTSSFGAGVYDMWLVKLAASGTLQWTRTMGGTTGDEEARSIVKTTDGGYAVGGFTNSFGAGSNDFYIVKLDASGTLQWSKTIGGTGNEEAWHIIQTTDGGYAVAGWVNSFGAGSTDMYIVKLDSSGNTCGNSTMPQSISGTGGTTTSPPPAVYNPFSTVNTPSPTTGTGGTVTAICTLVGIQPITTETPNQFLLSQNYPNPFNPKTVISYQLAVSNNVLLKVYDILGKEVSTIVNAKQNAGSYTVGWDASNYPSGIYFYKLTAGDYSEIKIMTLLK